MKTLFRTSIIVLFMLCSGCSALLGPRDMALPRERLQQELDTRFPFNDRYLALFDVTLSQPRLTLRPEQDRIELRLEMRIVPVLTNQPWYGSLTVSGSPQVDAGQRTLVLAQPRIDQFVLDGMDPHSASQLSRIGGLFAEQMMGALPLHRFEAGDFRHLGVDFTPIKIGVRPQALVITFEPVK